MEKHIRKNKLKLTFTDQLGKAVSVSQDEESEISSKKEAKKLAFYLFWNMRATLSRLHIPILHTLPHTTLHHPPWHASVYSNMFCWSPLQALAVYVQQWMDV